MGEGRGREKRISRHVREQVAEVSRDKIIKKFVCQFKEWRLCLKYL